jgi:hypothetical protein
MTGPQPPNGAPPAGMVAIELIDMAKREVHLPYMNEHGVQQFVNVTFDQMFFVVSQFCQALMQAEKAAQAGAQAGAPAGPSPILRAGAAPALTPAQIAAIAAKQGRR